MQRLISAAMALLMTTPWIASGLLAEEEEEGNSAFFDNGDGMLRI